MGKFGKKLLAEQIPGWSDFYLDYKTLKKIIGSVPDASLTSTSGRGTFSTGEGAAHRSDTPNNPPGAPSSVASSSTRPQPPLWDSGIPPLGSFLTATPTIATSSALDEDRGQEFQLIKASFFFRLQRELDKVSTTPPAPCRHLTLQQINTFYLQKEAELKLRSATLLSKQRAAADRILPDIDDATPTTDHVEWRAVEEGFRLLQNDLLKLQVSCA